MGAFDVVGEDLELGLGVGRGAALEDDSERDRLLEAAIEALGEAV
jgi:hypothetical protein